MAAVGSVVGGGMAAGAIITAVAPVAAVASVAYLAFKLFED
ncbi:putative membrane protein [Escherichia coli 8.0566]|nr:putative membrane protein [Escherichia coli 8.0566]EKK47569.1 putative membrane protein [Escherichia coli 8.0569]